MQRLRKTKTCRIFSPIFLISVVDILSCSSDIRVFFKLVLLVVGGGGSGGGGGGGCGGGDGGGGDGGGGGGVGW